MRRMAEDARAGAAFGSAQDLAERARSYQEGAEIIRRLLESGRRRAGGG